MSKDKPSVPESKQCKNTVVINGVSRTCRKQKNHSGKHHDHPWLNSWGENIQIKDEAR